MLPVKVWMRLGIGETNVSQSLANSPQSHPQSFWEGLLPLFKEKWASQVVLVVKNLPANAGDITWVLNPWVRRSPGGGHGNRLQYSCLENPMDRGAWWKRVHRVAKELGMTEVNEQEQCAFRIRLFGK